MILEDYLKVCENYQNKIPADLREALMKVLKKLIELNNENKTLKDKIHRRNLQIKQLKGKIERLNQLIPYWKHNAIEKQNAEVFGYLTTIQAIINNR